MAVALTLVGGDEIIEPFLLENTDGTILDLATVDLTGGVWWRGQKRIDLTLGAGITINNELPDRAVEEALQIPHGVWTLSEVQTALLPFGAIAGIRLVAITKASAITMSTYFATLERIT